MKLVSLVKITERVSRKLERDVLRALPNLLPPLKLLRASLAEPGTVAADVTADIATPSGRRRRLAVVVHAAATPGRIPAVLHRLARVKGYPVLASTFLSPGARQRCQEAGIGYLDLAGNCYLQFDDFHLEKHVETNPFPLRGRPASLFTPISSRILRRLLEPPAQTWKVSALAQQCQVSLGQASKVCRRLIEEEYAALVQRQLKLTQPGKLLEAWSAAYTMAHHTAMAYYSFERDPERVMARVASLAKEHRWRYAFTSFAAASLVAPFVRGVGVVPWYIEDETAAELWVQALDLRPVEHGANVLLRCPYDVGVFAHLQTVQGMTLVGNIQLYLDLYSDPARGREQAEFLRKERIGF